MLGRKGILTFNGTEVLLQKPADLVLARAPLGNNAYKRVIILISF